MKMKSKIAALGLALCLIPATLFGCRSEAKIAENLEAAKAGVEKARSLASGEILVYATFKTEKEAGENLRSSVTESYAKFIRGDELEYDFTETETFASSGETKSFDANHEGGKTIVTRDGVVVDESEAPDIFEAFVVDYTVADVDSVEAINGDGQILYTFTMTKDYASKFDSDSDGVAKKCKSVKYNYYVDADGVVRTLVSEFTYDATFDGATQTVVSFCQTAINS